ncbi:hypothetical protein Ddye_005307 [Dipteronia dyeriana]|uniref:Uncharacterized protein n=1 Tax=Dipteronia dyeriana TaxID=168575 RepID=A0AAD9XG09_9ROSI|nr:hypothetical protein Ddye_005307 [Dipteronia dyeriana]
MNDKVGDSDKVFSGMFQVREAVDDCDLFNLGFSSPRLIWNNKRDGKGNIQERLDRFLAKFQWRDNFQNAKVSHLGFFSSDSSEVSDPPHCSAPPSCWGKFSVLSMTLRFYLLKLVNCKCQAVLSSHNL